jgi:hypothetical protein
MSGLHCLAQAGTAPPDLTEVSSNGSLPPLGATLPPNVMLRLTYMLLAGHNGMRTIFRQVIWCGVR